MTPASLLTPVSPGLQDDPGWWRRHRTWLTAMLLMVAAWVCYLPSIHYGFIYYDDVRILKDHPELYGQAGLGADLKAIFVTAYPREEPLLMRDVSWALDSRLFGFPNPFGYHLGNVLLNGLVVALLFTFLLETTRSYPLALMTAAAFSLLAVHVEPVAWIMGRKDLLSALFMLLALVAQARRLGTTKLPAQFIWYAATLLCFVIALLSKISVLAFPMVLWLHAVFRPCLNGEKPPGATWRWDWTVFRETSLAIPSLIITGVVYVWYQRMLAEMGVFARGYHAHGFEHVWNLLMVNPCGFWLYLRQIFWPSHLALLYTWPSVQPAYPAWQKIVSLTTIATALGTGIWLFFRRKDLFFYYAAFFALMVPYLNLIYIGIWVADRYVYFSVICVLAIVVSLGMEGWKIATPMLRRILAATGLICLAHNASQAFSYQPVWRNAETFWQYHMALPHDSVRAYDYLASYYYADLGDARSRQDPLRAAVACRKMDAVIKAGLARFWPDQKQPPPPPVYFLFFLQSLVEEVNGQPEAALSSLLTSDRLHPSSDPVNLNLSRLYRKLAAAAKDPRQRAAYLYAARDRFAEHIHLVYSDRPAPAEERAEMAELEAQCSALPRPAAKPATPP